MASLESQHTISLRGTSWGRWGMAKTSIPLAAKIVGITDKRLYKLIETGAVKVKTDTFSGMKYLTDRELEKLKNTKRVSGRPPRAGVKA